MHDDLPQDSFSPPKDTLMIHQKRSVTFGDELPYTFFSVTYGNDLHMRFFFFFFFWGGGGGGVLETHGKKT